MSTENKELLKLFASMLRKREKDDTKAAQAVDPSILYYLSRKDIVGLIVDLYGGELPNEPDIATLENKELLAFIPDNLFIIAHFLNQWCDEFLQSYPVRKPKHGKEGTHEN